MHRLPGQCQECLLWAMHMPRHLLPLRTQGSCQESDLPLVWPANHWRVQGRIWQLMVISIRHSLTEACSTCALCAQHETKMLSVPYIPAFGPQLPAKEVFVPDLGMAWQTFELKLPKLPLAACSPEEPLLATERHQICKRQKFCGVVYGCAAWCLVMNTVISLKPKRNRTGHQLLADVPG